MPETTAPAYSIVKLSAIELMTHPRPTVNPPNATMILGPCRGPRISTIQPSTGVSQVSSAMKMANANWIDAIDQPCALLIGLTNSVHPYCRLAIITMQMMTIINWAQREALAVDVATGAVLTAVMVPSLDSQALFVGRSNTRRPGG